MSEKKKEKLKRLICSKCGNVIFDPEKMDGEYAIVKTFYIYPDKVMVDKEEYIMCRRCGRKILKDDVEKKFGEDFVVLLWERAKKTTI